MAKNAPKKVPNKTPQQPSRLSQLGGWKHPLAALLLLVAIVWAVAAFFATTTHDFPQVGEVPWLFGIGKWNYAIAAAVAFVAMSVADRTRPAPEPGKQTIVNRWAGPAMVASAIIGLLWIVVFYVVGGTNTTIPIFTDLGQWNIVIGMGFILAAFGFAMKWE